MNPKIALIHPPANCVNEDRKEPPIGLLYIAATIRKIGYTDVSVYDMTGCRNEKERFDKIQSIPDADIYGVHCLCTNYNYAKQAIERIRIINPHAYILIGGPNPSGAPEFTLQDSGADVVAVGEGEDLFKDCVDSFIKGNRLTGIIKGHGRDDIDSYPFPARDLVDLATYTRTLMGQPVISLLSSRGCKHHCFHCNSVVMGGGNYNVRYRSAGNIALEIDSLRDTYDYFRFNDDHFTGNPGLEDVLEQIQGFNIQFRIFARVDDLNDESCRMLKEAGCVHVSIGLESLNYGNLKSIGKISQIGNEGNVRIAKSHGLIVRSSFMVGLPFDTDRTIDEAFRRASQLGIDEFAIYPLMPYPGTKIWKNPERFGYTIVDSDFIDYVQIGKNGKTCFALKHKNFGPEDVERWLKTATQILKEGGAKHVSESEVAK